MKTLLKGRDIKKSTHERFLRLRDALQNGYFNEPYTWTHSAHAIAVMLSEKCEIRDIKLRGWAFTNGQLVLYGKRNKKLVIEDDPENPIVGVTVWFGTREVTKYWEKIKYPEPRVGIIRERTIEVII